MALAAAPLEADLRAAELYLNDQISPDERLNRIQGLYAPPADPELEQMLAQGYQPQPLAMSDYDTYDQLRNPLPPQPEQVSDFAAPAIMGQQPVAPVQPVTPPAPQMADPASLVGPGQTPGAPAQEDDGVSSTLQQLAMDAFRQRSGGGGRLVKGGEDVLQGYQVERAPGLTDEEREAIDYRALGDAGRAVEMGETQAQSGLNQAMGAYEQSQALERQLNNQREAQLQAEQAVQAQEKVYAQAEQDAKYNPDAYFEEKGALGGTLALIGIAMMAFGGADPVELQNMVRSAAENDYKRKKASAGVQQEQLEFLRKNVMSPQAQQDYEMGLKMQAIARQTEMMAATAASREAQQNGFQIAADIQKQAEEFKMKARMAETGTRVERHAMTQDRIVGGGAPRTQLDRVAEVAKKLGITPTEAVRLINTGKVPMSEGETKQRALEVPGEGMAFDAPAATKARGISSAMATAAQSASVIRDILKRKGTESLTGTDKARLETESAALTLAVQAKNTLGSLDNGLLEFSDKYKGNPTAFFTSGPTALAQLDQFEQAFNRSANNDLDSLIVGRLEKRGAGKSDPRVRPAD